MPDPASLSEYVSGLRARASELGLDANDGGALTRAAMRHAQANGINLSGDEVDALNREVLAQTGAMPRPGAIGAFARRFGSVLAGSALGVTDQEGAQQVAEYAGREGFYDAQRHPVAVTAGDIGGSMVAPVAGGLVGGTVGSAVPGVGTVGGVVGGTVLGGAANLPGAGFRSRMLEEELSRRPDLTPEQKQTNIDRSYALDAGTGFIPGGALAAGMARTAGGRVLVDSVAGRLLIEGAEGAAFGAGTDVAQQGIDISTGVADEFSVERALGAAAIGGAMQSGAAGIGEAIVAKNRKLSEQVRQDQAAIDAAMPMFDPMDRGADPMLDESIPAQAPVVQTSDSPTVQARAYEQAGRDMEAELAAEAAARDPGTMLETDPAAQQAVDAARTQDLLERRTAEFAAAQQRARDEQAAIDLRLEQEAQQRAWLEEQAQREAAHNAERDRIAAEALAVEEANRREAARAEDLRAVLGEQAPLVPEPARQPVPEVPAPYQPPEVPQALTEPVPSPTPAPVSRPAAPVAEAPAPAVARETPTTPAQPSPAPQQSQPAPVNPRMQEALGGEYNPPLPVHESHGAAPAAKAVEAGRRKAITPAVLAEGRRAVQWTADLPGRMFGAFQGNKKKATAAVAAVVRARMPEARRKEITKTTDGNGGSGSYGLSQALTNFDNLKEHDIVEWDEARLGKIQMAQTEDPRAVMQEMEDRGMWAAVEQEVQAGGSGGKITGRLDKLFDAFYEPGTGRLRADLTPDERREAVLLRTLADTMPRSGDQAGKIPPEQVYAKLRRGVEEYLIGAKALGDAARRRGVAVNYINGDSHAHQFAPGRQHFVFLDPPYYDTAGYSKTDSNPQGLVPAEVYAKMPALMKRLRDQGNAGVYTDEAWWGRERKNRSDTGNALADETLRKVYDESDTFDTHAVGDRRESIAFFDGTNARPEPLAVPESAPSAGGDRAGGAVGGEPGRVGAPPASGAAPSPSPAPQPAASGVTLAAARNDAAALAPLIGDDPKVEDMGGGRFRVTGSKGTYEVTYGDSMPAKQVDRVSWLNSILTRGNGQEDLRTIIRNAGILPTLVNTLNRDGKARVERVLLKLKDEDWELLYAQAPVRAKEVLDTRSGADMGAIIAIDRALAGTGTHMREEYGHHLWRKMAADDPALAARIIATEASPSIRKQALNPDGTIKDAGLALEEGTRIVNAAINKAMRERVVKGAEKPPATGILGWIKRFIAKLFGSAKSDPGLRPSQEAARRWMEGQPAKGAAPAGPKEAYSVKTPDGTEPEDLEPGNRAQVAQQVRRALAKQDQPQSTQQWIDEADRIMNGEGPTLEQVSNKVQDAINNGEMAGVTPGETIALERAAIEVMEKAIDEGGIASARLLDNSLRFMKQSQVAVSRAGQILRAAQWDARRPEDVRRLLMTTLGNTGSAYWQRRLREATTDAERAKVGDDWSKARRQVVSMVKNRTGIDLMNPAVGDIFAGDAYALDVLRREIAAATASTVPRRELLKQWYDKRFSWGAAQAEIIRGSILTFASPVAQAGTYVLLGARMAVADRLVQEFIRRVKKDGTPPGFEGSAEVFRETADAVLDALETAKAAFRAGKSVSRAKYTGKIDAEGETAAMENPVSLMHSDLAPVTTGIARAVVTPGSTLTAFADEFFWSLTFRQAQTFGAAQKRARGDVRDLAAIKLDDDIIEAAERRADEITFRGGYGSGGLGRVLSGLEAVRRPTATDKEGNMRSNPVGMIFFPMLPIFKSLAKAFQEAGRMIDPWNVVRVGKAFTDRGLAKEAEDLGITPEAMMEVRQQAAIEAGGRMIVGAFAGLLGAAYAGTEADPDAEDKRLRESVETPSTLAGVPTTRLSPFHEVIQGGAIAREAAQAVNSGESVLSAGADAVARAWSVLVSRPITSGFLVTNPANYPSNPETGEKMNLFEQYGNTVAGQVALGRPYIDVARRMTETNAKVTPRGIENWLERNYSTNRQDRYSPLTGTSAEKGGFVRQMVFGGETVDTKAEQRIAARIVAVNDALLRKAGDNRILREQAVWQPAPFPRVLAKNPTVGVELRLTDEQYQRAVKIAGTEFAKRMGAVQDDKDPAITQARMKAAWAQSKQIAEAMLERETLPAYFKQVGEAYRQR